MGLGIQIKKPEHLSSAPEFKPFQAASADTFSPLYYLLFFLTFPAALVAIYFFFQTRTV